MSTSNCSLFRDLTKLKVSNSGKTQVFIFLLTFCVTVPNFAQRVGFGPKIGGNLSLFRGTMQATGMRGMQPGINLGGYMSVKFQQNKKWQLELDVLYSTRGNRSKFYNTIDNFPDNDLYKTNFRYKIAYLEVPILFKYMLNRGGMTRPYFIFGPTYSGILSATRKDLISGKSTDVRSYIKRDDLGFTVGWGITGFLINHWYHLDFRYYHGFIDLSDNLTTDLNSLLDKYYGQEINSYYNSTFSLTMGISLERPSQYFLK